VEFRATQALSFLAFLALLVQNSTKVQILTQLLSASDMLRVRLAEYNWKLANPSTPYPVDAVQRLSSRMTINKESDIENNFFRIIKDEIGVALQHTSAYVSILNAAYVSIRQHI
jgi:hypothetical protein